MTPDHRSDQLQFAVAQVAEHMRHCASTVSWFELDEASLWYELVECILGSRVPHEHSQSAAVAMETAGLLEQCRHGADFNRLEHDIAKLLSEPRFSPLRRDGGGRVFRYPMMRAHQVRITAERIYGSGQTLKCVLARIERADSARRWLISQASGVGPKQASLFLRNVGFTDELAVLDIHVLRYMFLIGLLANEIRIVPQLSHYLPVEEKMRDYADTLGFKVGWLDVAIWVVMRVSSAGKS